MWIECGPSNSDPAVIAGYYVRVVQSFSYCPTILVSDAGSENTTIASLQAYFRRHHTDRFAGLRSHRYCKSTSNQRIESYWSFFRKDRADWWINYFKGLERDGHYNKHNIVEKYSMRYCMMPVIRKMINDVAERWNKHRICRNQRNGNVSGIPNIIYFTSQVTCSQPVNDADIQFGLTRITSQSISGSVVFDNFAAEFFRQRRLQTFVDNAQSAFGNFQELRNHALVSFREN